jgi:hypothetical protein
LREEHRPREFENRVLRKILGPKTDEKTGDWRRLHNEELLICTHKILFMPSYQEMGMEYSTYGEKESYI